MTTPGDPDLGPLLRRATGGLPITEPDPTRLALACRRQRRQRVVGRMVVGALLVAAVTASLVAALRPPAASTRVATTSPPGSLFPVVRGGQACPSTPGRWVENASFDGYELGGGPVRMLVANEGELQRGIVYIAPADKGNPLGPANYYAFQNFWYSLPSYRGPWTVTARRLDGPGHVLFGDSYPTVVAQPVPAGAGYRTGIGSTWVSAPGCYGFHVSGPHLSETVVVDVELR